FFLTILGVRPAVFGDLLLVLVAHPQQILLVHNMLAALFEVVLQHAGLDYGIDRAGLFAKAAINAFKQIDVVKSRTASAVGALFGFYGNRQRGTNGFAQLAGNTALFAV